jgi:hypothetical protein
VLNAVFYIGASWYIRPVLRSPGLAQPSLTSDDVASFRYLTQFCESYIRHGATSPIGVRIECSQSPIAQFVPKTASYRTSLYRDILVVQAVHIASALYMPCN